MASIATLYKHKDRRGDIAVKKSYLVPLSQIYVESGFNVREIDHEHVGEFEIAYKNGDYVPPIVVEVCDSTGKMKVVDGHHRYEALVKLKASGVEVGRVQCESFSGGEMEQLAFMVKSSQGRNLTAIERANAYKRLESLGNTISEIASLVGRSQQDIRNHLEICDLGTDVKRHIAEGSISASLALEISKSKGEKAVSEAVNKSIEKGVKKATRKSTSLWKPKLGKIAVEEIKGSSVEIDSNGYAIITVDPESWIKIKEAMDLL